MALASRVGGVTRGTHESLGRDRHADRGDRGEQGSDDRPGSRWCHHPFPASPVRGRARLVRELRRQSSCPGPPVRRTSRSLAGVSAGSTITCGARTISSRVCRDGARRRARPGDGETMSVDIGRENPVGGLHPGTSRAWFEALTDASSATRHPGADPATPDENGMPWNDSRVRHLWSTRAPILSASDLTRPDHGGGGPAGSGAGRGVRLRETRVDAAVGPLMPAGGARHSTSCSTLPPGRRSTTRRRPKARVPSTSVAHEDVGIGKPVVYYSTDYVFDGRSGAVRRERRPRSAVRLRTDKARG